jgi:multidrug efflux pump subunit AcrA (membrane-fusion protein)
LRLKVIRKVRLQVRVPSRYAGRVKVGSYVSADIGGGIRKGIVSSVFPAQDSATRTFIAEALLENPKQELMPGAFAEAGVSVGGASRGIAVRDSAIRTDANGKQFVWMLQARAASGKTDYTCVMHPEVSEPKPGLCPICKMELTPRESAAKYSAERRFVQVDGSDGEYTRVLKGIAVGDRIIYAGHEDLIAGAPVLPTKWAGGGPVELPNQEGR